MKRHLIPALLAALLAGCAATADLPARQTFDATRDEGLAIGADQIIEFYRAPERLQIHSVDGLFVLLRLLGWYVLFMLATLFFGRQK